MEKTVFCRFQKNKLVILIQEKNQHPSPEIKTCLLEKPNLQHDAKEKISLQTLRLIFGLIKN